MPSIAYPNARPDHPPIRALRYRRRSHGESADAMRLSTATLDQLGGDVERPAYDRAEVSVGIVHLGVGGFHRAHQAMYLDRLMNAGQALDFGICGVGILAGD